MSAVVAAGLSATTVEAAAAAAAATFGAFAALVLGAGVAATGSVSL
ncbi:hypothetical protein [Pedobacter sp. P26]